MQKINLADNTIDIWELEELAKWLMRNPRLTKGPLVIEFEKLFSEWIKTKYSIFVNSGSSANLLMIYALLEGNYLHNRLAIAPSVSWVTTVAPLMQLGFDTYLCECDKQDLGYDINYFEHLCKKHRPSLAIIVHVLGHSNKLKEIQYICKKYNVILIEDTCEALGSRLEGRYLGTYGKAGSFSFYYGHHISTIEGGMVVTEDEDLYNLMLSIRSHGWGRDINHQLHEKWKDNYNIDRIRDLYTFYFPGFNLRPTDLNAFIGISQMKKIDKIVQTRETNYLLYTNKLKQFWRQQSDTNQLSSFAYGTLVKNRLDVFTLLEKKKIESRPLICGNIGLHPFWIKKYGPDHFTMADIVHMYGMYLPNHHNITKNEIERICKVFKEIAEPLDLEKELHNDK